MEGRDVGELGASDGRSLGELLGAAVGCVGANVGSVGALLGSPLGDRDGGYVYPSTVGLLEGRDVGALGPSVGPADGASLGVLVGSVGAPLGSTLGARDGGYV